MALYSLANQAGAAFRAALNTVLGKMHRNYYGSTDPATGGDSTPGMIWVDTGGANPVIKMRNAADSAWISLGTLNTNFELAGSTAFGRSLIDDAAAVNGRATLGLTEGIVTTSLASQAEAEAGSDNTKLMTPLRVAQAIAELAGPWAYDSVSLSGTSVDWSVPAGTEEIIISAEGWLNSTSGSLIVQMGTGSPGIITTGYKSFYSRADVTTRVTTGFAILSNTTAMYGPMRFDKMTAAHRWDSMHGVERDAASNSGSTGGGTISLGSALTTLRFTTVDAGTISGTIYIKSR